LCTFSAFALWGCALVTPAGLLRGLFLARTLRRCVLITRGLLGSCLLPPRALIGTLCVASSVGCTSFPTRALRTHILITHRRLRYRLICARLACCSLAL
jgi:hypothetical protein